MLDSLRSRPGLRGEIGRLDLLQSAKGERWNQCSGGGIGDKL